MQQANGPAKPNKLWKFARFYLTAFICFVILFVMMNQCYNRGVIIHLVIIFVVNMSCNQVISFTDDQTNDKKIR